jgi:hypothetical protein
MTKTFTTVESYRLAKPVLSGDNSVRHGCRRIICFEFLNLGHWDLFEICFLVLGIFRFGSNIGHGLFVGWVEHLDIFFWVSFLNPTYVPAIFLLSAKPNKMAEDKTVTDFFHTGPLRAGF